MSKTTNKFSPEVRRACRADGSRRRGPARIPLAGDPVDCREDRLLGEHA